MSRLLYGSILLLRYYDIQQYSTLYSYTVISLILDAMKTNTKNLFF